jgi:hypothetical protein
MWHAEAACIGFGHALDEIEENIGVALDVAKDAGFCEGDRVAGSPRQDEIEIFDEAVDLVGCQKHGQEGVLGAERIMVGRLSGSGRDGKTAQIVDR